MSRSVPASPTVVSDDKPHGEGRTRKSGGELVHPGPDGEAAESALQAIGSVAFDLSTHPRTVTRMVESGAMPPPIRLGPSGSIIRWRRKEIERWIAAGCPRCDRRGK